ncbi:DUF4113 domain-containing protein [Porphyromonadaceae bacterium W3.11]|nr:DUF4113 domain-containing protein [Porphyromonadaceae bacterium W3.11]
MYALMDCNNFYVSCERLFRPDLNGRPVVVLSNNDGCVISRSNEAKALGIPMGIPLFQIEQEVKKYNITVCSSNFELYGDLSKRVMAIAKELIPDQEIYSIDECFLRLQDNDDYLSIGKEIRQRILKGVGIPTCIGLAQTKTLAKLANKTAKKDPAHKGVFAIDSSEKHLTQLHSTSVGDVWGIGKRNQKKMELYGVNTALDFIQKSPAWVRQNFTLTGLNTYYELRGEERFPFNKVERAKSIGRSRSFGVPIDDEHKLYAIIMEFVDTCCNKLVQEGLAALKVMLYIHTNQYSVTSKQHHEFVEMGLTMATSNVTELAPIFYQMLKRLYRPGYKYKKAGVIFSHLVVEAEQLNFIEEGSQDLRTVAALAQSLNKKYGKTALYIAARDPKIIKEITNRKWVSPRYTTNLQEIIEVKAED